VGLGFLLAWVLTGAATTVYLGNIVQGVDPMLLMVVTLGLTALFFNATQVSQLRAYADLMRRNVRDVLWLNLLTVGGWVGYFASLYALEPAVAEALILGIGPLSTLAASRVISRDVPLFGSDIVSALGILGTTVYLSIAVLGGDTAMHVSTSAAIVGIVASIVSGVSSSVMMVISKRLHEGGFSATQVTGARFYLLVVIGTTYVLIRQPDIAPLFDRTGAVLLVTAIGLVIPLYFLQKGVELAEPVTEALLSSMTPMIVFAMQHVDSRLGFSSSSLIGTVAVAAFVAWGSYRRYKNVADKPG
jgi:drug/metabolite transporter (DMT)-like permease